jgi:solute carrier family 25 folate transporter 32
VNICALPQRTQHTMSHERSTPSSPVVRSGEQFPSSTGAHFARTSGDSHKEDGAATPFELWAMGKSYGMFRGLAGAAGGITSGFITCPLDVIKTKLQAQGGFRATNKTSHVVYRGLIGTGRVIWREEGLRGMYRGLGPIILGYLPTWAVWFTVYGRSKEYFNPYFGKLNMGIHGKTCANF